MTDTFIKLLLLIEQKQNNSITICFVCGNDLSNIHALYRNALLLSGMLVTRNTC